MANNNRDRLVQNVQNYLRKLSRTRRTKVVTADDIHTYLDRQSGRMNSNARLGIVMSAFRTDTWKAVGETASQRDAARYRKINEYRYNA